MEINPSEITVAFEKSTALDLRLSELLVLVTVWKETGAELKINEKTPENNNRNIKNSLNINLSFIFFPLFSKSWITN